VAATPQGAALTERHRVQQLAIQAGSIDRLLQLWRGVDVTRLSDTIDVFAQAAALLAGQGFTDSATAAAQYYSLFRATEIGSGLSVPLPSRRPLDQLSGLLRGAALSGIITGRRSGMSISRASQNGLIKAVGTLGKLVLAGGRMTITTAVQRDRQAIGWMRATSGDPCPFCRMLASRGASYTSEGAADFEPHDACGCTAEPLYRDTPNTLGTAAQSREFLREFEQSKTWARDSGTMSRGTSNDALNDYRRWIAAGKPTAGDAGTEISGQ